MRVKHGGLWHRLLATWIDAALVSPLGFVMIWAVFAPVEIALPLLAFASLLALASEVVLTALLGRTLGKMALGLQVVDLLAQPISWGRALLRSSPRIVLLSLQAALLSSVLLEDSDAVGSFRLPPLFEHRARLGDAYLVSFL